MKKAIKILKDITLDIGYELTYFAQSNMKYVPPIAGLLLPYGMYMLGQLLAVERGGVYVGGELFIPVACIAVIHYVREFANKSGKGSTIPIPEKRFTEVDKEGEVTVVNSRLQELLLYMADLEDYMQRRGWL